MKNKVNQNILGQPNNADDATDDKNLFIQQDKLKAKKAVNYINKRKYRVSESEVSDKKEDKIEKRHLINLRSSKKSKIIADDIDDTDSNVAKKKEVEIENIHPMTLRRSKRNKIIDNAIKPSIKKSRMITDDIKVVKSKVADEKDKKRHICTRRCGRKKDLIDIKKFCSSLRKYLNRNNSDMKSRAPTPADGNCFYYAVIDQIHLLNIKEVPKCHKQLRHAICGHLSNLPEEMNNSIKAVHGENGLGNLAKMHKKNGEFVDGEMVQATALYLNRNILIYAQDGHKIAETKIEGGDGSDAKQAITIFYSSTDEHYQSIYNKNVNCN